MSFERCQGTIARKTPATSHGMGSWRGIDQELTKFSPPPPRKNHAQSLATGKYGCTEVRMYPAECSEQLGRDPSEFGSSKSLVLKSFSGEGTHWDASLLVSLTLWDTPVLFTPPLPLPQKVHAQNCRHSSSLFTSLSPICFTPIFCFRGRPKYAGETKICHHATKHPRKMLGFFQMSKSYSLALELLTGTSFQTMLTVTSRI